jgi:hypothetical protein
MAVHGLTGCGGWKQAESLDERTIRAKAIVRTASAL